MYLGLLQVETSIIYFCSQLKEQRRILSIKSLFLSIELLETVTLEWQLLPSFKG
jgi:hypothetical protein